MCRRFWHYQKSITTAHTAQELVIRFFKALFSDFKLDYSSHAPFAKLITVHPRHSQNASSTLSAASQLIFAYKNVRVNCNQNCKLILNFLFFSCFCSCTRAIIYHKISKFRYKSTMVFDEFQLSCLFSDISSFLCMFRLSFAQQAFLFPFAAAQPYIISERRYFHGTSGYE